QLFVLRITCVRIHRQTRVESLARTLFSTVGGPLGTSAATVSVKTAEQQNTSTGPGPVLLRPLCSFHLRRCCTPLRTHRAASSPRRGRARHASYRAPFAGTWSARKSTAPRERRAIFGVRRIFSGVMGGRACVVSRGGAPKSTA